MVYLKYERGDEDRDPSSTFSEYDALQASVKDGFLRVVERVGQRIVHVSLDQIAMWTEEEK